MQSDKINITLISNGEHTDLPSASFEYDFYDDVVTLHISGTSPIEEGSKMEQFIALEKREDIHALLNDIDILPNTAFKVANFRSTCSRKYQPLRSDGKDEDKAPEWQWSWGISLTPPVEKEEDKNSCPCSK